MPKQIYKIDQFHGGLNTQANPSDIDDNQLVLLEDGMVDELGKIKECGGCQKRRDILNRMVPYSRGDNQKR